MVVVITQEARRGHISPPTMKNLAPTQQGSSNTGAISLEDIRNTERINEDRKQGNLLPETWLFATAESFFSAGLLP